MTEPATGRDGASRKDGRHLCHTAAALAILLALFFVAPPHPAQAEVLFSNDFSAVIAGNGAASCGNGVVDPGEECDDANIVNGDGCDWNCTPTRCGNGVVTTGEWCDDGNLIDGDDCSPSCAVPGCGNAIPEGDEECDDGGVCVGGTDEGTFCSGPEQCFSGECGPTGGDGCAANCTNEDQRLWVFESDGECKGGDNDAQPCEQ